MMAVSLLIVMGDQMQALVVGLGLFTNVHGRVKQIQLVVAECDLKLRDAGQA